MATAWIPIDGDDGFNRVDHEPPDILLHPTPVVKSGVNLYTEYEIRIFEAVAMGGTKGQTCTLGWMDA